MGTYHQDRQTKQLPLGEGQMGTARFPRQAVGLPTDRFSCFHKTRISDELPDGSQQRLGSFHIDLKTAFLQGQSYDVNRDVVCQLPPEANQPPFIAARLKKPAYGMNDAPRRWWNILDKALRNYGMIPTRADRCYYVLYSLQSRKQAWEHWIQGTTAQENGTKMPSLIHVSKSEMESAFEKTLDPI